MSKYEYLTDDQANLLVTIVNERFAVNAPERFALNEKFFAIRTKEDIDAFIVEVKQTPTLARQQYLIDFERTRAARVAQEARIPTEEGYYRNPATGELTRLTKPPRSWEFNVYQFSEKGGPRRLLVSADQIVKGKWTKLTAFAARSTLRSLDKDWKVDPETLAQEYAYGFCPIHHGPLQDAVSVILGYGPDCAEANGLPWSLEAAEAKLAANRATAEVSA